MLLGQKGVLLSLATLLQVDTMPALPTSDTKREEFRGSARGLP